MINGHLMRYANLMKNKLDHFRYWWVVKTKFSPVNVLMDIGGGNRPQNIIHVRETHYVIDPTTTIGSDTPPFVGITHTWADAIKICSFDSVEVITLVDVVEHLEKEEW